MTRGLLILLLAAGVAGAVVMVTRARGQADEPYGGEQAGGDHRYHGPADHSFADVEKYEARFENPERAEWQKPDEVVAALEPRAGMVVADIGSGTGYFSRRFAAAVGDDGTVYAADIEPAMGAYVRDRADREGQPNIVPVLASADDPRLPNGRVDLIFICDTWHHIDDRVGYARRLRDDLAPGGRVAIVDFLKKELPVGPPVDHKLTADEVKADFAAAGYELVASPELLRYQYFLIFRPSDG